MSGRVRRVKFCGDAGQYILPETQGAPRAEPVSVQIRVGLNFGEIVVRAIGSDPHMDYTATGQTIRLAARMEQLATTRSAGWEVQNS